MYNRQQAQEDALFVLLMGQVALQENQRARQVRQQLEADPEAALPLPLQQRRMQTIRKGLRRRDRQATGRTVRRIMGRVAVAVLAAILCLTAAFAVSPALRSKTVRWFAKTFPTHTELRLNPDAPQVNGRIYEPVVKWLPAGLTLEEQVSQSGLNACIYTDSDGCWLEVRVMFFSAGGCLLLDTEDANTRETVINGYPAITTHKGGISTATCTLDDLNAVLLVTGQGFSVDDVVRVAENIRLK